MNFQTARRVAYAQPKAITKTPADIGLSYRDVSFPSRENHVLLRGWFIPGVLPDGQLTTERTIIMVHGLHSNRAALEAGLLDLSGALARLGFAILAFDMRGQGQSAPAPLSMGYYEQFDVLGAGHFDGWHSNVIGSGARTSNPRSGRGLCFRRICTTD